MAVLHPFCFAHTVVVLLSAMVLCSKKSTGWVFSAEVVQVSICLKFCALGCLSHIVEFSYSYTYSCNIEPVSNSSLSFLCCCKGYCYWSCPLCFSVISSWDPVWSSSGVLAFVEYLDFWFDQFHTIINIKVSQWYSMSHHFEPWLVFLSWYSLDYILPDIFLLKEKTSRIIICSIYSYISIFGLGHRVHNWSLDGICCKYLVDLVSCMQWMKARFIL